MELIESTNEEANVAPPEENQEELDAICRYIASRYVRKDGRFYRVESPGTALSADDVQRITLNQLPRNFPNTTITQDLPRAVFKRVIGEKHSDPDQSVPVWDGSEMCKPAIPTKVIRNDGAVSINRWSKPAYRSIAETGLDLGAFGRLLDWIMASEEDRTMFLDWLSWCLQNEADKPTWAPFLYSRRKGTGKSTVCQVVSALFGNENTMVQNSVTKLTSRFNLPLLMSKLVISEELSLRADSAQGNTLKTYITETSTTSEAKGREVQRVEQCCCFLFTTNHLPNWIEPGDRRYLVIDVDHDGHASGTRSEEFGQLVSEVVAMLQDPRAIARLYNALMGRRQSNAFNAKSLNVGKLDSPVMKLIMNGSSEVALNQLEELLNALGAYAIGQTELVVAFRDNIGGNSNRLRHMMPDLGWRTETVKWGGVDYARALYVHRDYTVDRGYVLGPNGYREPIGPRPDEDFDLPRRTRVA